MVTPYQESNDGTGRIILWITFGLMAGSAVLFALFSTALNDWRIRTHAVLSTAICSIAAASYYALATNRGHTPVLVGDGSEDLTRDVFYARYIDWTLTTPLLLTEVLLLAGAPFGVLLSTIFSDVLMIVLGLLGAITVGKFKWGWYGMACLFLVFVYAGLGLGVVSARKRDQTLKKVYLAAAGYLFILWLGYPIVWGLAEGSNKISVQAEAGSYAGLDIAAKVLFGFGILSTHRLLKTVQDAEAHTSGGNYIYPLLTPINNLWGTPYVAPVEVPAGTTAPAPPAAPQIAPPGQERVIQPRQPIGGGEPVLPRSSHGKQEV